ncbi:MAG: SAM-dependent methyltransferase [Acidobacteriaceae bacterium]|nr:SAM-dependent methyltransferase [Acidobacteriaceae bacterium]
MSLRGKILQEIGERGPIPFSRYMELCLYDPQLGYYSRSTEQFGKAGDFYTSSDVHAVFGRLLARLFEEMWRALGSPEKIELIELGPGRGLFARDVLDWCEKKFPDFFVAMHYSLAERSDALKERLLINLGPAFSTGKASFTNFPDCAKSGPDIPIVVFANEFFDALPVEVLSSKGELRVGEENGRLVETWASPSDEELCFLDRFAIHPQNDERVETPLLTQRYMSQLCTVIRRGFVIAIDYGYTRDELLAGRHRGTVMAYRQHSVSADPYEAPGEQDITAHVNFTGLSAAADKNVHVQPLLTQSQFLLGIGEPNQFADAFEECRLPQERAKVALQLKHLVTPAGLGETFHVLVASKGVHPDTVSALSGLSFGRPSPPNDIGNVP